MKSFEITLVALLAGRTEFSGWLRSALIYFDCEWTEIVAKDQVVYDCEVYINLFMLAFKHVETGKMALLNNRKFIGVELSPEYVEIAKKRIESS